MSDRKPNNPNNPIDSRAGVSPAARKLSCEEWEAMLVDLLDGTLPAGDVESFQAHQHGCASCAEMFSQAGQGREWLNFLRVEPQVSPILVSKILAQTSGAIGTAAGAETLVPASVAVVPAAAVVPIWHRAAVLTVGRRVVGQPRLMMTAAMAFFSITLTLNIAGVRLSAVRLADLKPAALSNNLDKQYHMASARVVRYYDNIRFVYEMEATVRKWRLDTDLENSPPADKPGQPSSDASPSHKSGGKSEGPDTHQPQAMLWGEKVEAQLDDRSPASKFVQGYVQENGYGQGNSAQFFEGGLENIGSRPVDQAKRGIV
jgi:hypothetical protein